MAPAVSARVEALAAGLGAAQGGMLGAIVVMPLDMIASKQACGDERGALQIVRDVVRRDGVLGLWSSRIIVWKSSYAIINRGLMYMSLSWLTSVATARFGQLGVGSTMLLAYVADLLTKPLVAPLEGLVIRLNKSETGETATELIPKMLKEGGPGVFWRGITTHLGASWRQAITEAIFEQLRRLVGLALGGNRQVSSRLPTPGH